MIVEYNYDYLAEHGSCPMQTMDEFNSVDEAIDCIGYIAYHNAIDEQVTITRVIDGPIQFKQEIQDGIAKYVKQTAIKANIFRLKGFVKDNQKWLENVEAETVRRQRNLIEYQEELEAFENELKEIEQ